MIHSPHKNSKLAFYTTILAFTIIGGFLFFGGAKDAKAAETCKCTGTSELGAPWSFDAGMKDTEKLCEAACLSNGGNGGKGVTYTFGNQQPKQPSIENVSPKTPVGALFGFDLEDKVCKASFKDGLFSSFLKCFLNPILQFAGWLLSVAVSIFAWAVDADKTRTILNQWQIYYKWTIVRDVLNMGFILFLIYTAFNIIFQTDNSNKKVILTVVLMALLVNFSFPISRFIIDIANVLQYTLLKTLVGDPTQSAAFIADKSMLGSIINPGPSASIAQLFASIIFVFILAITFLTMAILFLIRTIALALIIISSPIAFVGVLIGKGGQWWDYLFKYSFFGPIMVFMLFIATNLMSAMGAVPINGGSSDLITIMSRFIIPIVILWIGMGIAQRMGIEGASMVTGQGQKFLKWAGMKFSGGQFVADTYKAYHSRREQAKEDSWSKKLGTNLGSQQDRLRAWALPGGKDAQLRYERDQMAKVKKEGERNDTVNMATHELRNLATNGNKFEKAAAMQELANRSQATQQDLDEMRTTFGETSQVFRQLQAKIKTYDPVAAFAHMTEPQRQASTIDFLNSNQFDAKKIGTHSLGDEEFMELAMGNESMSIKDINELSKDVSKKAAMEKSIGAIINEGHRNSPLSDADKNIHMANFSLTGKISDAGFVEHITKNLDKENATNMTMTALSQIGAHKNTIKQGRIKDIVENIKDNDVARELVRDLGDANTSTHANYVNNNAALKNYF